MDLDPSLVDRVGNLSADFVNLFIIGPRNSLLRDQIDSGLQVIYRLCQTRSYNPGPYVSTYVRQVLEYCEGPPLTTEDLFDEFTD